MAEGGNTIPKTGYFKVGVSYDDPGKRLRQLQTGNPRELTLPYHNAVSNMIGAEKVAHDDLDSKNLRGKENGGKEWFKSNQATILASVQKAVNAFPAG